MIGLGIIALVAGLLVGLSRQVNGRLGLATTALNASFWNHLVGLLALTLGGLLTGAFAGVWPAGGPWWLWLGGPIGVVFIALSSFTVVRLGATVTALLVISGNMISGVALDLWLGAPGSGIARALGVGLVLAGAALTVLPRR